MQIAFQGCDSDTLSGKIYKSSGTNDCMAELSGRCWSNIPLGVWVQVKDVKSSEKKWSIYVYWKTYGFRERHNAEHSEIFKQAVMYIQLTGILGEPMAKFDFGV